MYLWWRTWFELGQGVDKILLVLSCNNLLLVVLVLYTCFTVYITLDMDHVLLLSTLACCTRDKNVKIYIPPCTSSYYTIHTSHPTYFPSPHTPLPTHTPQHTDHGYSHAGTVLQQPRCVLRGSQDTEGSSSESNDAVYQHGQLPDHHGRVCPGGVCVRTELRTCRCRLMAHPEFREIATETWRTVWPRFIVLHFMGQQWPRTRNTFTVTMHSWQKFILHTWANETYLIYVAGGLLFNKEMWFTNCALYGYVVVNRPFVQVADGPTV